jgi:membrane associated rhomboid family serine protease
MSREDRNAIARELKTHATILGVFVGIMWVLELVDIIFFRQALNVYGIFPREMIGLRGILFAPFLHANLSHLISNTIPFLVLGWFVMLQETSDFFIVTAITMFVSGLGVWMFGATGLHVGASGVIFGYLGFLLARGYFQRNFPSILLSIIVGIFYGGAIWGVLPIRQGVSWEGHLFGFVGGVLAASFLAKEKTVL